MGSSDIARPFGAKGEESKQAGRQTSSANALKGYASELFETTNPLRFGTVDILSQVLAGGRPEQMRVFAPEREAVESQFRNARENLLETIPARGGELNKRLTDLEIARAQGVSGLEADVRRNAMEQALRVGFGVPAMAFPGLAQAGGLYGAGADRAAQEVHDKNSSIGSIAGIAALAAMGCWVAAAIYGAGTPEFWAARRWILFEWQGVTADLVRMLYRRYGPWLARRVYRHPMLRTLLRPLFDMAVRRGR